MFKRKGIYEENCIVSNWKYTNQIDHFLVDKQHHRIIKSVKSRRHAELGSLPSMSGCECKDKEEGTEERTETYNEETVQNRRVAKRRRDKYVRKITQGYW